jgi:hypothetical protein
MMETSTRGMALFSVIVMTPTIYNTLMDPLTPPHIHVLGIFGLIIIGPYIVGRTLNNNNKHGDKQ